MDAAPCPQPAACRPCGRRSRLAAAAAAAASLPPPPRCAAAQGCVPYRPAPYLVVPLETPRRALVLRRMQGSSGRGFAAVGSRVPWAGVQRPARGLSPRRGAPEPAAAPGETGAAAVRPRTVAVGRRVVGGPVAPRRGRHGAAAGRRAPEAGARERWRRGAEALPVHGPGRRGAGGDEPNLRNGHPRRQSRPLLLFPPSPARRLQGSGLKRSGAGRARRGAPSWPPAASAYRAQGVGVAYECGRGEGLGLRWELSSSPPACDAGGPGHGGRVSCRHPERRLGSTGLALRVAEAVRCSCL